MHRGVNPLYNAIKASFWGQIGKKMYKSTATLGDIYHLALPLDTQLLVGSDLLQRPVSWACSLRPSPPAFPKLDGSELALVDI